jgi:hypothetical protein
MKKLLFLLSLILFTVPLYAQEYSGPPVGKYLIKENTKISYNFNSAEIEDQRIVLLQDDKVIQVFDIVGFDSLKGFRITQVFPEVSSELKHTASMNAKTEFKGDFLYVLIEGNGNHGEFHLQKVD